MTDAIVRDKPSSSYWSRRASGCFGCRLDGRDRAARGCAARGHSTRGAGGLEGEIPGSLVIERNVLEWRLDPSSDARLDEARGYDVRPSSARRGTPSAWQLRACRTWVCGGRRISRADSFDGAWRGFDRTHHDTGGPVHRGLAQRRAVGTRPSSADGRGSTIGMCVSLPRSTTRYVPSPCWPMPAPPVPRATQSQRSSSRALPGEHPA